ncbi:hypothetical protein Emag_000404 [Eimeria magna]
MYGDDAAESCVIPDGIVSVYEALGNESTEYRMTALRASPPVTNVAPEKTEETKGTGETCKKRKRLEEASGAFGEVDCDSPG